MLYHGSNYFIKDELKPEYCFGVKKLIYATEDYCYALVRAGAFNPLKAFLREEYESPDKPYKLMELYPGAFKDVFDVKGYIYEVEDDLFSINSDNEYITESNVKIVKCTEIPNVWSEMMKYSERYELITYEESDKHWEKVRGGKEGYLKRRKERISKMLGLV